MKICKVKNLKQLKSFPRYLIIDFENKSYSLEELENIFYPILNKYQGITFLARNIDKNTYEDVNYIFNLTGKKSPNSIGGAMNCPIN